jgi:hypothetical protein
MAVPGVGVELCGGRSADRRAGAAVPELPASAGRVGRLLALAAGALDGRAADLDSAWSVCCVSAEPRAAAGSGAGTAAGRGRGDRPWAGAQSGAAAGATTDRRAARGAAHDGADVVAAFPSTRPDARGQRHRARRATDRRLRAVGHGRRASRAGGTGRGLAAGAGSVRRASGRAVAVLESDQRRLGAGHPHDLALGRATRSRLDGAIP